MKKSVYKDTIATLAGIVTEKNDEIARLQRELLAAKRQPYGATVRQHAQFANALESRISAALDEDRGAPDYVCEYPDPQRSHIN